MAWRFSVSYDDADMRKVLSGLSTRARNFYPALDQVGAMLMTSVSQRFEKEVDPDGRPWTPLAPATVKRKKKAGREGMLVWSRRLRDSITREASFDSVTVGTNVPYAVAHQFGAQITRYAHSREVLRRFVETGGRRELVPGFAKRSQANFASFHPVPEHVINIPARPFLGINADDKAEGIKILHDHVLKGER